MDVEKQCINVWKGFSKYVRLSHLIKESVEYNINKLSTKNPYIADIGGGSPNDPQSSSNMIYQALISKFQNYHFDVYDLNGENSNPNINFIKGPVQEKFVSTLNYYDLITSVNALQTPSIPVQFMGSISNSLKKNGKLILLLPMQNEQNPNDIFVDIESKVKGYPEGIKERRYSKKGLASLLNNYGFIIGSYKSIELNTIFTKKHFDMYFSNPQTAEKVKEFLEKDFESEENKYLKSKFLEYLNDPKNEDFKSMNYASRFSRTVSKKV